MHCMIGSYNQMPPSHVALEVCMEMMKTVVVCIPLSFSTAKWSLAGTFSTIFIWSIKLQIRCCASIQLNSIWDTLLYFYYRLFSKCITAMWYPLEIVMTSSPDISVKVNQQKVVGSPILMQVICITPESGSKRISPSLRC